MQILIVLSSLFYSLAVGYYKGVNRVLPVPKLYMKILSDVENIDDAWTISLMDRLNILASGLSFILVAMVIQIFGRKTAHIVLNTSLIISAILFHIANFLLLVHRYRCVQLIFAAQIIQSVSDTGIIVQAITISEYCHKNLRGIFMCLNKFAEHIGCWLVLYCFFISPPRSITWMGSWSNSYLFGLVLPCVSIGLTIVWPESPYFHALRLQYEDCEKSFKLLHGESEERQSELHSIIAVQQKKMVKNQNYNSKIANTLRKFLDKSFWKVFVIMTTLVCLILVVDMSENLIVLYSSFGNVMYRNYEMLFSGFCRATASLLSCAIILIKRRTVLLVFGFLSIPLMFSSTLLTPSLYEWVQLVQCVVILFHNFFVNLSIVPVCAILFGELYFLEHRGIGTFISGIVLVILKMICSFIISNEAHDLSGYALKFSNVAWATAFCLLILFFILPETKDKTLQEIESELRGRAVLDETAQDVEMGEVLNDEGNTEICDNSITHLHPAPPEVTK